jgi:hypothetical protein
MTTPQSQLLKIIQAYVVAFASLSLVACSGQDTSTPVTTTTTTTVSTSAYTPIIDNEDLSAGLKGIDANNNGIRDDIDRLIALRYAQTPAMKKAAEQKARALQKNVEAATQVQARIAGNEISRSTDCIYKVFPKSLDTTSDVRIRLSKEIEALTANTRERYIAYWNANKLMGGMVFRQPEEPVCD